MIGPCISMSSLQRSWPSPGRCDSLQSTDPAAQGSPRSPASCPRRSAEPRWFTPTTSRLPTTRSTGGHGSSNKSSSRSRGGAAQYQRYDWPSETLAEWHTIEPAPIVIIEGVSAGRSEWAAHLSFLIWIETPPEERLRRGVNRDGIAALNDWEAYQASEDAHYERDPTRERADVVIDGTHPVERPRTDRYA